MQTPITVIGGGLAGLTAAIACAEHGADEVHLVEAHDSLGGRARATVAAPGLLSEVAVHSALEAARSATAVSVA